MRLIQTLLLFFVSTVATLDVSKWYFGKLPSSKEYIATTLQIDDGVVRNIKVKIHGQTSSTYPRHSLTVKFDTYLYPATDLGINNIDNELFVDHIILNGLGLSDDAGIKDWLYQRISAILDLGGMTGDFVGVYLGKTNGKWIAEAMPRAKDLLEFRYHSSTLPIAKLSQEDSGDVIIPYVGSANDKSSVAILERGDVNKWSALLNTVYNGPFTSMLDLDSWAKYYFLQCLSANEDDFARSVYLHTDTGYSTLFIGPAWDGNAGFDHSEFLPPATGINIIDWINEHFPQGKYGVYTPYIRLLRSDKSVEHMLKNMAQYYQADMIKLVKEVAGMHDRMQLLMTSTAFEYHYSYDEFQGAWDDIVDYFMPTTVSNVLMYQWTPTTTPQDNLDNRTVKMFANSNLLSAYYGSAEGYPFIPKLTSPYTVIGDSSLSIVDGKTLHLSPSANAKRCVVVRSMIDIDYGDESNLPVYFGNTIYTMTGGDADTQPKDVVNFVLCNNPCGSSGCTISSDYGAVFHNGVAVEVYDDQPSHVLSLTLDSVLLQNNNKYVLLPNSVSKVTSDIGVFSSKPHLVTLGEANQPFVGFGFGINYAYTVHVGVTLHTTTISGNTLTLFVGSDTQATCLTFSGGTAICSLTVDNVKAGKLPVMYVTCTKCDDKITSVHISLRAVVPSSI